MTTKEALEIYAIKVGSNLMRILLYQILMIEVQVRKDMINESSIASHTLKLDNIDNWLSRAIIYSNNGEVKQLSEKESDIMKT